LKARLESTQAERGEALRAAEAATSRADSLQAEMEQARAALGGRSAEEAVADWDSRLTSLESDLARSAVEAVSVRARAELLEQRLSAVIDAAGGGDPIAALSALRAEVEGLRRDLADSNRLSSEEVDRSEALRRDLDRVIDAAGESDPVAVLSSLRSEAESLRLGRDDAETEAREARGLAEAASHELGRIAALVGGEDTFTAVESLNSEATHLRSERDAARDEAGEHRDRAEELRASLDRINEAGGGDAVALIGQLREQLAALTSEHEQISGSLEEKAAESSSLRESVELIRTAAGGIDPLETLSDFRQHVESLREGREQALRSVAELESQLVAARAELALRPAHVPPGRDDLKDRLERLEQELCELRAANSRLSTVLNVFGFLPGRPARDVAPIALPALPESAPDAGPSATANGHHAHLC
jgi:chromosome segregation ATPase